MSEIGAAKTRAGKSVLKRWTIAIFCTTGGAWDFDFVVLFAAPCAAGTKPPIWALVA
jgi:hypothetical protein